MSNLNANHIIYIDGQPFKANEDGMWNLTEIWKTLKLPRGKAPSEWKTKEAKRFASTPVKLRSERVGSTQHIFSNKQVTLKYAGWVSPSFEDMVYAAFESILAMPEVQTVVVNKMVELGYHAEAELLERHSNADRDYAHDQMSTLFSKADGRKPERLYKAVKAGHLTKDKALSLLPAGSVWAARVEGL
ncbi:TPA: hypothetical protein N2Q63_002295 [Citrobacter freundii]|nr:hypothetical protein [Citrobacter freundii]HCL6760062.1 hypothetical protein [Citrobacter freundii]HED2422767.1 hypothetical protein [Citrobacter freundii]HED3097085.1 hypothetical protein [Citrobacter freundii]HED3127404.1 hypothetical protein [Citrobacter freundii]